MLSYTLFATMLMRSFECGKDGELSLTSAFARRVVKHLREHASLSKPAALKPEGKYKDHR